MNKTPKPKLFKSKFGNGDGLCSAQKQKHATLGAPVIEPPNPQNFLRKNSGKQCFTAITKEGSLQSTKSKAGVSKLSVCLQSQNPSATCTNYEVNNNKNVRKMTSKIPKSSVIIDRFGSSVSMQPTKTCITSESDVRTYQKPRIIKSAIPIRKKNTQLQQSQSKEDTALISRTERKVKIDSRMIQILEDIDQHY